MTNISKSLHCAKYYVRIYVSIYAKYYVSTMVSASFELLHLVCQKQAYHGYVCLVFVSPYLLETHLKC
jgi:hypothetical protein